MGLLFMIVYKCTEVKVRDRVARRVTSGSTGGGSKTAGSKLAAGSREAYSKADDSTGADNRAACSSHHSRRQIRRTHHRDEPKQSK